MAKQRIAINPIVAERIRCVRIANKLTQGELAKKIGVSEQTIRAYETKRFGVPKTSINSMASIFNCCPEYLYGYTNSFTLEEYELEKKEISDSARIASDYQAEKKREWDLAADFFSTYLGYTISYTYKEEKDGSFEPIIQISNQQGKQYLFSSKLDCENFLLGFFDAVKKQLHFHLLDYQDQQNKKAKEET